MSSKGIEPFMVLNQFFYREPLLPIRSTTLESAEGGILLNYSVAV